MLSRNTIATVRTTFAILLLGFSIACARYHPPEPATDLGAATEYASELGSLYPQHFKLVQRIVLTSGGKEYDFIGYLLMDQGVGFHALGLGDMGGTLFDLRYENGKARIAKKPDTMPPKPLLEGVAEDIAHLFDLSGLTRRQRVGAPRNLYAARAIDGTPALVSRRASGLCSEYRFGLDNRLSKSLEAQGKRLLREATYGAYRIMPGWPTAVPTTIELRNRRWRYTLRIALLEIEPKTAVANPPAAP